MKDSNYSKDRLNSGCEAPLISNAVKEELKNSGMMGIDMDLMQIMLKN